MTWSYVGPQANPKDTVRFLVGDTSADDQLLSDEEIGWIVGQESNLTKAAYRASKAILFKLAREVSSALGPLREEAQQKWEHYKELSDRLYLETIGQPPNGMVGTLAAPRLAGDSREPLFTLAWPR